jgi:hypothetical protein
MKINELKIACDPVLCPKNTEHHYAPGFNSKRLTEPVFEEDDFKDIDCAWDDELQLLVIVR